MLRSETVLTKPEGIQVLLSERTHADLQGLFCYQGPAKSSALLEVLYIISSAKYLKHPVKETPLVFVCLFNLLHQILDLQNKLKLRTYVQMTFV